ncbi:MAG: Tol-Pal system beta propeller repeat protein TolB [Rickettsiales bacterium]|jgi:TolB protein|nr:Tol-Pal system beta propeller repeat protein TolB [Rickettsiales bacterium]
MKKFSNILILLIFLFAGWRVLRAEIYVDIDSGNIKPISIAIMDLAGSGGETAKIGSDISKVVTHDLKRSGLFSPIAHSAFIDTKQDAGMPPTFENWSVINAQALLFGQVEEAKAGKVKVEFQLWDIPGQTRIEGQILLTEKSNWRRIAHIISDYVYKRMTGDAGYFDTRIVYVAETGSKLARTKRLAIIDQDGANLKYLTDGRIQVTTPVFSPNSQKIAYMTYFKNVPRVYIFDIETGEQELLGNFPGMSFAPRFSPDGKHILMSIADEGNSDIYEMELSTKKMRQLTREAAIETAPTYSPDGKTIAFVSDRSGSPQLYTMTRKGRDVERISFGGGQYGDVAWSPRGDYLAFVKIKGGDFYIGIMFEDGTGERLIAKGYTVESPTWSPNGRRIIFYEEEPTKDGDGKLTLQSVDITGYNHEIIKTETRASDPAWSPLLP